MYADQDNLLKHLVHELRQPLSTIESIAYYLELALPEADSKVKEHLHRLRDAVAVSDGMLRDALALHQFSAPRPVTVDLDELFEEFGAPQFELSLGGAPVLGDYLHLRKIVETMTLLFSRAANPRISTRVLPSGTVIASMSGSGLPAETDSLAVRCLEQLAHANNVSLYLRLRNSEPAEITLDLPCAALSEADEPTNPLALAASAAGGSSGPTAPSTL
jgi:signal transduction histidine kinase